MERFIVDLKNTLAFGESGDIQCNQLILQKGANVVLSCFLKFMFIFIIIVIRKVYVERRLHCGSKPFSLTPGKRNQATAKVCTTN